MGVGIRSAVFVSGSPSLAKLAHTNLPEIAIIGRSNVGKSTFVNQLGGNRKLARTSSTPGKTTEINLFELGLSRNAKREKKIVLADLPGFGYAKLSKDHRERIAQLVVDYITKRKELRIILLLNDCRRTPEQDELALQKLAFENNRRLLVILTKADKLKRGALENARREVAKQYGLESEDILLAGQDRGPEGIWDRILQILNASDN